MAHRKHITELALNFCSSGSLILHPKDLGRIAGQDPELVELADRCHIYVVLTHPRVVFVPDSIAVGNGRTSGKFRYVKDGHPIETDFWFRGEAIADKVEISEYPHNRMSLIRGGTRIISVPSHLACLKAEYVGDRSIRNLEVVYVGMSYGDGSRSAKDRLASHSTLQRVLADLNHDAPDSEALIAMFEYVESNAVITFDGTDKTLKVGDDRDVMDALKRQTTRITEELRIKLVEAALIRYFQPAYNEKYKNHFPTPTQKILEEVYEIDFGALVVEINTEDLGARIYSPVRGPGHHHVASFDLHDRNVRRSFFSMGAQDGLDADTMSGPFF